MPRFEAQRVTSRQPVDSSQSANVSLATPGNLQSVMSQGSAMAALGHALNGMSQTVGAVGDQNRARQDKAEAKQAAIDKTTGAEKAAEHAVTGASKTDLLKGASDVAQAAYQQTDGINAVGKFEESLQKPLASLEPGADIDGFMKTHAEQFITDQAMDEPTRSSFLTGLSKTQDGIKQGYLKQSIKESMKRQDDGASALLTAGLTKGNMGTPEGYANWRHVNAINGMSDDEMDTIAVNAVKSTLASGDIDAAKVMGIMQSPSHPGGPILADIPAHKEELQLAAKRGESIIKDRNQKARYDQEVADTVQIDSLADKGILGKNRALEWGKANDKTAAEVASKINSSREAGERLAKATAAAKDLRGADIEWMNHDALTANRAGFKAEDINKAGDRAFTGALQSGDDTQVFKVLDNAMRTGAPIPALKGILSSSLDESNPAQATRYSKIIDYMFTQSPARAAANLDDKTLSRYRQYKREILLGANENQAWSKVKIGTNLDPETINQNATEAMKIIAKDAPKGFTAEHFWQSNTPIANAGEMQSAYRLRVRSMVEAGISPKDAAADAITRVQASYIRVGNRMVPNYGTGDGMDARTSAAMTEVSSMWKGKLVTKNVVGKDDEVLFTPVPGDESKWRLRYFSAGGVPLDVTHEVTRTGADGKEHTSTEFVDVVPAAARANYGAWDKQESDKKVRNAQFFKSQSSSQGSGSGPDLTPAEVQRFQQASAASDANMAKPAATELGVFSKQQWNAPAAVNQRKKLADYVGNPSNTLQSFSDFIDKTH